MQGIKQGLLGITVFSFCTILVAQTPMRLNDEDKRDIQALTSSYLSALFSCNGEGFADLFVPRTGSFASGFRGQMVGREQLIGLVESERHCTATDATQRGGGTDAPTVSIAVTPEGVVGVADLAGGAQYQDSYVKTPSGWRFASRWVLIAPELEAGLDAGQLQMIQDISGPGLGENHVADDNGIERLLNSGVSITVTDGKVSGRAFLEEGGYDDIVYEKRGTGQWAIVSRVHGADD